ncbi:MAG: DEAD/DEAH box helicase [Candidatus Bipolaricaulota bacterium]
MDRVLDLFCEPVARWFRETYGEPTPAQALGWPPIAAGQNTLVLAPTGSGKTLAAFLFAIHERLVAPIEEHAPGVHTLYLSPLRALASDVHRALQVPLSGIQISARAADIPLPDLRVGLRTGDTPAAERQRMVRRPPDLLVTTPESLHLLLTSPKAREGLRAVRYVIVDEIHALCGEKRGSFLALLLERLEALVERPFVRIGLSATQRPLDRVARFLGGYEADGTPRPVTVIDAGARKNLDLRVVCPVEDFRTLPPDHPSVWPALVERLVEWVADHASTLVFANNRRAVERLAAEMNRAAGGCGARAHHGSVSKEVRHQLEQDLKAGRLPALVATASLELGIDMGAIDLVCQVESPNSVAAALQRVGRAGHAYRATSKGRMLPKSRSDLLRMAGMARSMLRGEVSEVRIPQSPLDVLAQQIVAMVAVDDWRPDDLYARIRCAGPYRNLSRASFDEVVHLVGGGYRTPALPSLRARVTKDARSGRLTALPGARQAATLSGGTIPETGQYAMVLEDGTRLGELDEEFVFERRLGDTFVLGTSRWRIVSFRHDRVVVAASAAEEAQLPFWKGDGLGHDAEFGRTWGAFLAECGRRAGRADFETWLAAECALDEAAARNAAQHIADQLRAGPLPDDRTILVDVFPGDAGDGRMAVVSTFGRAFHLALWLALQGERARRGECALEGVVSNDGFLLRLGGAEPDGIVERLIGLADGSVRERVLDGLADSPAFSVCFRRNAARALILPRTRSGTRVPLWLQRLRAADLLAYAAEHPRFPIVLETYRELVEDVLPLESLDAFLALVRAGEARFAVRRGSGPTPFSASLVLEFVGRFLYEAERPRQPVPRAGKDLADELLGAAGNDAARISEAAVAAMEERLQGLSPFTRARDGAEILDLMRRVGDLTQDEIMARCEPPAREALNALLDDRQIVRLGGEDGEPRWIVADDPAVEGAASLEARVDLARRHVEASAGRTRDELAARYAEGAALFDQLIDDEHVVVDLPGRIGALIHRDTLVGLRRMTLTTSRRAIHPVPREALFGAIARRQHLDSPLREPSELVNVLLQLSGWPLPPSIWPDVLAVRVVEAGWSRVDALVRTGDVAWCGGRHGGRRVVSFVAGGSVRRMPDDGETGPLSRLAERTLQVLRDVGASFLAELARYVDAPASEVDGALWELTWRGLVTNDSVSAALRAGPGKAATGGRTGRWTAIREAEGLTAADALESSLRVTLARFGFVSREMLEWDSLGLRWGEAYPQLSRLEWRGELERGHFVSGLSGPQFAVPGFAASLVEGHSLTGARLLHAYDPANPFCGVGPLAGNDGVPLRRGFGSYIVTLGTRAALAVEGRGRRVRELVELNPGERRACLEALRGLVGRPGQPAALRVASWNGRAAAEASAAADMADAGFMRDDREMVFYRGYGGTT